MQVLPCKTTLFSYLKKVVPLKQSYLSNSCSSLKNAWMCWCTASKLGKPHLSGGCTENRGRRGVFIGRRWRW